MCTCLTSCRAAPGPGNLTDFECNKRCLRYPHSAQCPRQVRTPEIYRIPNLGDMCVCSVGAPVRLVPAAQVSRRSLLTPGASRRWWRWRRGVRSQGTLLHLYWI